MGEIEWRAIFGPEPHVFFIGTNEETVAFLPEIILAIPISNRRQTAAKVGDFIYRFGDKILVLCRLQRQGQPRQRRHFTAPEARCIHNPLRMNIALFGTHDPRAIRLLVRPDHGAKPFNRRPHRTRARRIGHGHARRVHIAAFGFKHNAAHVIELRKRMQFFGLFTADLIEVQPIIFRLRFLQAQLVLTLLRLRQIKRPRLENATALPGLFLQLFIKVHRIVLDTRDIVVVMQPVDIGGRMPSGPRGQLVPFQKNNVTPTEFREVIEDRAANQATTDHHCLCMRFHKKNPVPRFLYRA